MNNTLEERLRTVAQILISEIGADGPMDAEDAASKAVQTVRSLRDRKEGLLAEIEAWKDASGLEQGGDPDGITPDDLRAEIEHLRATREKSWSAADEALIAELLGEKREQS